MANVSKKKKKQQENSKRRKIFILIIMILFTGVILTASTYAWFTANQTVTVEDIDVNVAASNGLQISVDGADWKPFVSKQDIIGASRTYNAAVNQVPQTMVPVSTIGETEAETGFMKMFKGVIVSGDNSVNYANILTAEQSIETNTTESGDFIAFDLFFQITEGKDIYLTDSAAVTSEDGRGIENAARVAFIKEGNVPNGSELTAIQALKTPDTPVLWEPNNNAHTPAAVNNALSVYKQSITTNNAKLAYKGVKAPILQEAQIVLDSEDETYFADVNPALTSTTDGIPKEAYLNAFHLDAGITKVRIYLWIEGQDVDCENDASGSDLTYSLQFSILSSGV